MVRLVNGWSTPSVRTSSSLDVLEGEQHLAHRDRVDGEFGPGRMVEPQRGRPGYANWSHDDLRAPPDSEARRFAGLLRQRRQDRSGQLIAGPFDRPLAEHGHADAESVPLRRMILVDVAHVREGTQQPVRRARTSNQHAGRFP